MLFNSTQFLVFFPIVLALYFQLKQKGTLVMLLMASYYFYMCWQPKYVILILLSTIVDYFAGLWMGKREAKKSKIPILIISLTVNLGLLFFFKYFNFFNESLADLGELFSIPFSPSLHKLLLPVGISFYTFQTLSYSIDVYNGKLKLEKDFIKFAVFVSFFPQLVAGPIERATNLLPQFSKFHKFDKERILSGLQLVLWGFFKKIVIADRLAAVVDTVYATPDQFSGLYVLLATYLFAFQIYCDFSGYSDIAIGIARMMGYDLITNFRTPYFSKSIREFWSRWHISLSTWFRDYVYVPLGGNRTGKLVWVRNILITFIVSGFWHGANWTFISWGLIHGLYLLLERGMSKLDFSVPKVVKTIITFHMVLFAWMIFRANSITDVSVLINQIFSPWDTFDPALIGLTSYQFQVMITLLVLFFIIEAINEKWELSRKLKEASTSVRLFSYSIFLLFIALFGIWNSSSFIYFQF